MFTRVVLTICLATFFFSHSTADFGEQIQGGESIQSSTRVGGLTLLSFNAWALPVWIPGMAQAKRYRAIPNKLIEQAPDILCVQESFAVKFRKRILRGLSDYYYSGSDYSCNQRIAGPIRKDCYGGLMTFSKYPVIDEEFYPYPTFPGMRIEEVIGAKGFLLTTVNYQGEMVHVIKTHLYAGADDKSEKYRHLQIKYMHETLDKVIELDAYPVFLLGDLNTRHPDISCSTSLSASQTYEHVVDKMQFIDPSHELLDNWYTMDYLNNPYAGTTNGREKLDYCLYRSPSSRLITTINQHTVFTGTESISDHLGWWTEVSISGVDWPALAGIEGDYSTVIAE
ncbi:MAG: endonuclease/exonuclease/phosphatase family protein [Bacteroidota bacterium]